jgi:hypothetical protein
MNQHNQELMQKEYTLKTLRYPYACTSSVASLLILFATALTAGVALAQPNVVAIASGYSHSLALIGAGARDPFRILRTFS